MLSRKMQLFKFGTLKEIRPKVCLSYFANSPDGGGNQCCYDAEGNLMYTQDRADGSTADRAHIWGTPPYAEPYKVPILSHTFHDILPYHYCCIWTDNLMETW